jgi:ATP-binding cassette subfamily F protein 3
MSSEKNLLQLSRGRKAFGLNPLFTDATFSVNENEHLGLIGPNGAGKSTLFKILTGEESLDEGQLVRSRELRLGYLSQHDLWEPGETGNAYLERQAVMPLWQVKSLGRELKVSEEYFSRPITSLSGGYRMRIKLMGLLGQNPNLMLLDEPTNYLDLETTLLLERFLQEYAGAFILISHDREFLRRTTDHILEIETGEMIKFNGNIDDYFEQKEGLRRQLEARAQNLEDKRQTILDFVSRFGAKATKARQAQSRLKALEKMEHIDLKPLPVTAQIRIPEPEHVGKAVIRLDHAEFGYGDKTILKEVSLEIKRGDHVAVVGLNGAGKSTLLKGLAGSLAPQKGERQLGYQVNVAIYNQHVIEVLNPRHSVLQSMEEAAHPGVDLQKIKDLAGALLFSGESVHKPVRVLSGGEKSRVALGRILLQKAPFLLLDEPTNHLDFQTVEALIQALRDFEGTLVVVSHDRGFVRRVGTKILEVSGGGVQLYPGSYDEYVWSLQRRLSTESEEELRSAATGAKPAALSNVSREEKKEVEKRLRKLEKEIAESEKELSKLQAESFDLNRKIADQEGDLPALLSRFSENARRIEELEENWLIKEEEKENLRRRLEGIRTSAAGAN